MLQPVERWIERPLLDTQLVLRDLLDAQKNRVAVQRPEGDGLENQQVQRALQQLGGVGQGRSPRMTNRK
jgi:hypothetical protein